MGSFDEKVDREEESPPADANDRAVIADPDIAAARGRSRPRSADQLDQLPFTQHEILSAPAYSERYGLVVQVRKFASWSS